MPGSRKLGEAPTADGWWLRCFPKARDSFFTPGRIEDFGPKDRTTGLLIRRSIEHMYPYPPAVPGTARYSPDLGEELPASARERRSSTGFPCRLVLTAVLRAASVEAELGAGVSLWRWSRRVATGQREGCIDPRTTMRCDRALVSLGRHASYVVAAFWSPRPADEPLCEALS
jgi:hypothetical protein